MAAYSLDAIDHEILYHLQEDAHQSLTDIADSLDVAVNTVRNRIQKLENEDVITGYTIDVDYDRADVQHHYLFFCTVRVSEREPIVEEARNIPGVVRVTTVMTGEQNVILEAVASEKGEITEIAYQVDDLGLHIEREHLIREQFRMPFSGFRREENR